jgi:type II secretory pathway component PulK
MTDRQITYAVVGGAALISVIVWVLLVVVPAWTSYWRLRDRLVSVALSVYILAAFVMAGAGVGAAVLWYYDRL